MMRSSNTWGTRGEGHVCVNLGCLGCPSLYENRSIPFSWLIHCPPFIQHIFTGLWVLGLCSGREEPAEHRAQCAPSRLRPSPLYLVDSVQTQRLAIEPQEQGQELGAEVVGVMMCQEGSLSEFPRLTPPSTLSSVARMRETA